jgi:hypothetical protein
MMLKRIILYISIFLPLNIIAQNSCLTQDESYSRIIIKSENYITILENVPFNDTIVNEDYFIIITFLDCKGKSEFTKYDKSDSTIILTGDYNSSLALLAEYVIVEDLDTGDPYIAVNEYYEPLPNGSWKYYINGSLIREEIYISGILRKTIKK